MTRIPFPNVPIGEFTVARHFTAPCLFFYRNMQAQDLLHFPDMAGGDMSAEQRREALDRMVSVQRPLAALVLFLNIVALEDLFVILVHAWQILRVWMLISPVCLNCASNLPKIPRRTLVQI